MFDDFTEMTATGKDNLNSKRYFGVKILICLSFTLKSPQGFALVREAGISFVSRTHANCDSADNVVWVRMNLKNYSESIVSF